MKNRISFFISIVVLLLYMGCANRGGHNSPYVIVFIHGAYHGNWTWDKVRPLLEESGIESYAIDLPGHGNDTTNVQNISLQLYIDRIVEVLKNIDKPVILVGHSAGGMSISGAAEQVPVQIEALVYATAVIPRNGESLLSVEDPNPGGIQFYEISEDGSVASVIPSSAREVFYHDVGENASDYIEKLNPEPIAPLVTPIELTDQKFGSIPRYYIECTEDKVFSIDLQRLWQKRSPCKEVYSMTTGHSPFLANPQQFTAILMKIIQTQKNDLTPKR